MRKQVDVVNQKAAGTGNVLELIHTVMHLYRGSQFRAQRDSDGGVSPMESKVLGFFARHPGATQSELVEHSRRDKGQLARLISGLKERGLLEAREGNEFMVDMPRLNSLSPAFPATALAQP